MAVSDAGDVATDVISPVAAERPTIENPAAASPALSPSAGRVMRRGLPRRAGGELWPPAGVAPVAKTQAADSVMEIPPGTAAGPTEYLTAAEDVTVGEIRAVPAPTQAAPAATVSETPLRRGLPRTAGADAWPAAGFAPAPSTAEPAAAVSNIPEVSTHVATETPVVAAVVAPARTGLPQPAVAPSVPTVEPVAPAPSAGRATLAVSQAEPPDKKPEPRWYGRSTLRQWTRAVIGGTGLLITAVMTVVFVRWFISVEFMRDFLTTYPGEYHLPENASPGFPGWVQWQHFFNVFLMVLIIRSGLQVRNEKRPSAFWTPKWSKNGKGKISLALWFHQSLDILWLLNGVVFVVLLFVTGHWMRIVPTSWEVFPNAVSALLQYVSLSWPTENGWVNYNSLQQLMYFITVFLAAPLAAITGVRMSGIWPKNAKMLNRVYPVEWARAIHFPVMLYFTAFIIVHVALVFATGALRNLNHMYGGTDIVNWAGFWIFFVSLLIIVAGWIAARPLLLAPIAKLSGKVTAR